MSTRLAMFRDFANYLVKSAARGAAVRLPPVTGSLTRDLLNLFSLQTRHLEPLEAVESIPLIFSCIESIQQSVAQAPLVFYKPDGTTPLERAPKNPAYLFGNANPEDTGQELIQQIVGSRLWGGTAFVFIDYQGRPEPQELWCIRPDAVEIVPRKDVRGIDHYLVDVGRGKKVAVPPFQMLRFPMYSTRHSFEGLSPVRVIEVAYTTQRNASLWLDQFFRKGGMMAGVFTTEQPMLDDQQRRFRDNIRLKFQGLKNAFDPVSLDKGMKFERVGMTLAEMQLPETLQMTTADILNAFLIPPVIMGVKQGGGLSDAGASTDLLLYWERAVMSTTTAIAATINERLLMDPIHAGEFGPGLTCRFDFSRVRVLQEASIKLIESGAKAAGNRPIASVNEIRALVGLPRSKDPKHDEIPDAPSPQPAPQAGGPQGGAATDGTPRRATSFAEVLAEDTGAGGEGHELVRARQDARLGAQERVMARGIRLLGRQQEKRVVAKVRSIFRANNGYVHQLTEPAMVQMAISIDGRELLVLTEADRRLLRRYHLAVLRNAGYDVLADLGLKVALRLTSPRVEQWLRERVGIGIVGMTDTTRQLLVETLSEGVAAGETQSELVARVREIFRERYYSQATTIVRTETGAAYNFGAWEGMNQAEEATPGVIEGRRWVTAHDERVRPSHADADGQVAPLAGSFRVGGAQLRFPGDHSLGAPPEETINCRCQLVAVLTKKAVHVDEDAVPATIADAVTHLLQEALE